MPLWNHQQDAVDLAMKYPGFYIAHDMGCGKSFSGIEIINRIDNPKRILILCPKSVIDVWPTEFAKYGSAFPAARKFEILPLNKKNESVKKKAERLKKRMHLAELRKQPIVVVINFDAVWRSPMGPDYNKKNRLRHLGTILSYEWDLVIADEAHRAKTPSSKIAWFCYEITKRKKAKKRLCLSGTPLPHSPLDIYSQYRFMDPTIFHCNFQTFKMEYAEIVDMGDFKKVAGYKNLDKLYRIMHTRMHRVEKRDVLDLPPVMDITRYCDLDPKTARIYSELEDELTVYIEEHGGEISVSNVLTKLLRLQQLTGGYLQLDDGPGKVIDSNKMTLVQDIFEDLPPDEPIVVFANFSPEIARIKEVAEKNKRTAAELSGSMNQLKEWQDGKFNVLVVQIQAGGVGIDLTRAHYTIYFSTGYSLGNYMQSKARTDRPGQTKEGFYYHLVTRDTVDEDVLMGLGSKSNIVEGVLKGRFGASLIKS